MKPNVSWDFLCIIISVLFTGGNYDRNIIWFNYLNVLNYKAAYLRPRGLVFDMCTNMLIPDLRLFPSLI